MRTAILSGLGLVAYAINPTIITNMPGYMITILATILGGLVAMDISDWSDEDR